MPFAWLSVLLNKTTLAVLGAGALVLLVAFQGIRLEQAREAADTATQRAVSAEAAAAEAKAALETYAEKAADNRRKQETAGKIRQKTQAKVASVISSNSEAGAEATARSAVADLTQAWETEDDEATDE